MSSHFHLHLTDALKRCAFASILLGLRATGWSDSGVDHWLVVANDQSISYTSGKMAVLDMPRKGSLTVVDIGSRPRLARSIQQVPTSVIGPPTSIALHPTRPQALVVSAMRAQKTDGTMQHVPDDRVSLVWLGAGSGRAIIETIAVGRQPSSVSILPDGCAALVTNRAEGTISVLDLAGDRLRETARVAIAGPADSLAHIEISADGKWAIATLSQADEVLLLNLAADGTPKVIDRATGGRGPYAARFLPQGSVVVANIVSNELTFFATGEGKLRATGAIPMGRIPEGIDVSPDGEWIAVSCMEGANLDDRSHPSFGVPGRVHLLRRIGTEYQKVDQIDIGCGPQTAVFSCDSRYLLVTRTGESRIALYVRERGGFVPTGEEWDVDGEPIAATRR